MKEELLSAHAYRSARRWAAVQRKDAELNQYKGQVSRLERELEQWQKWWDWWQQPWCREATVNRQTRSEMQQMTVEQAEEVLLSLGAEVLWGCARTAASAEIGSEAFAEAEPADEPDGGDLTAEPTVGFGDEAIVEDDDFADEVIVWEPADYEDEATPAAEIEDDYEDEDPADDEARAHARDDDVHDPAAAADDRRLLAAFVVAADRVQAALAANDWPAAREALVTLRRLAGDLQDNPTVQVLAASLERKGQALRAKEDDLTVERPGDARWLAELASWPPSKGWCVFVQHWAEGWRQTGAAQAVGEDWIAEMAVALWSSRGPRLRGPTLYRAAAPGIGELVARARRAIAGNAAAGHVLDVLVANFDT